MEEKKTSSWDSSLDEMEAAPTATQKKDTDDAFIANLRAEQAQQEKVQGQVGSSLTAPAADGLHQPILRGDSDDAKVSEKKHNRTVSWDVMADKRGTITQSNLSSNSHQHYLPPRPPPAPPRPQPMKSQSRKLSNDSAVSSIQNSPRSPTRDASAAAEAATAAMAAINALKHATKLEMETHAIVNELRSESNLIRDLDKTNPLTPKAGTANAVFGDVPMDDDMAHNFVIEDDQGLVLSKNDSTTGEAPPLSPKSSGSEKGRGAATGSTSHRSRTKSQDASVDSTGQGRQTDHTSAQSNRSQPFNRHKRLNSNTVEENLFGLNSAFEEMRSFDKTKKQSAGQSEENLIPNNDVYATAEMLFNRKVGKADVETGGMDAIDEDAQEDSVTYSDDGEEEGAGGEDPRQQYQKKETRRNPFGHLPYAAKIKSDWEVFSNFLQPRQRTMATYARFVLLYIMLPSLGIACILYYLAGNPPDGKCETSAWCEVRKDRASASWWVLFIGCRQVVICILALMTQGLVIDFFAFRTTLTVKMFGPMFTLFLVQSKGWPFCAFFWGVYNFAMIVGDSPFSNHWLFWQDLIGLMNAKNPPGFVTSSTQFYRIVSIAMAVGVAVAAKRVAVGVYLGKQTFAQYSERLSKVMHDMLAIGELARFGQAIEERSWQRSSYAYSISDERLQQLLSVAADGALDDDMTYSGENQSNVLDTGDIDEMENVINTDEVDPYTGLLKPEQQRRVVELLGQWEEPRRGEGVLGEVASVGAVMQFRRALASMDTDSPFGGAFGSADTREECIARSQALYDRLMLQGNKISGHLHFNVIAYLAVGKDGELDQQKCEDLIQMFRPDRDGGITLVEFVRSVDKVYKELRLLRATIAASAKIDKATEAMFNIAFYAGMVVVILYAVGIDPLAMFLSLSSVVLAFSFMIGSASAKYFEGVLLVLVQKPYGIGDRVSFSNPESTSPGGGSQTWFVKDVTLFKTTLQLAATGEQATVSNSTIAKSRIINAARSPNAILFVTLRFGIDEPYHRIETFRKAVELFVKSKPREWLGILGFRVSSIETERGFIEYGLVLQHRESWQNIGPLLDSRNTMQSYCLELSKRLDMKYINPPLPVQISTAASPDSLPKQVESLYDFESAGRATENQMADRSGSVDVTDLNELFDGKEK